MKKKIGILTFHRAENYGAILQAYALQKKTNELFGESEIIDFRNKNIENPYKLFKISGNNLKQKLKRIISSLIYFHMNLVKKKIFKNFYKNKMHISRSFNNVEEFKDNYNVFIAGSDQIWNANIVGELSDVYTLNFETKENAKKISYAASIGNSSINEEIKNIYKDKISKIDNISVREEDAKRELSNLMNNKINVVLDPTLLLTKEEWEEEIKDCLILNEKYIFAYVITIDEEYIKIVNKLSKETGLKVIHFGKSNPGYKSECKSMYSIAGPLDFISLIKNAEYVVATSFHATVFATIFNKKFFIVPHKETGSRVKNILKLFNVSERICNTYEEFIKKDYDLESDWNNINKIIEEERKKSIKWLEDAINS